MKEIAFENLVGSNLIVDAIYLSDRTAPAGALAGEPLNKLMTVGNMGGFRTRKGKNGTLLAVLTSTGTEAEWPDSLDTYTGIYTYYGDNRSPGREMHQTKQRGNQLLQEAFASAHGGTRESRMNCPLFFVFEWAGNARDQVFRGLAIPGSEFLAPGEDLVAVWRSSKGERFQNYRASFTILDEASISGSWVQDSIKAGEFLYEDIRAPKTLTQWINTGKINPLVAEKIGTRNVSEQIPQDKLSSLLLSTIYEFCDGDPWKFEKIAAEIWKLNCPAPVEYELTRRFRDGGRDALGHMLIGPSSDPIKMSFSLEAKLYGPSNHVGVKELSRLISRIKHREFGVFVTTSAVGKQAYDEVRDDQHPIVIITGRDICQILNANGITSIETCNQWLRRIR